MKTKRAFKQRYIVTEPDGTTHAACCGPRALKVMRETGARRFTRVGEQEYGRCCHTSDIGC